MSLTKADVARLRGLREKRAREAAGRFVVEGSKVVGELLGAGRTLLEVYATDDWRSPQQDAAPVRRVSPQEMARISHFPTPSNVLAVGAIERASLRPGELNHGYSLALDGIQDPGNVGTLLRIADWFGFDRVLLSPECADLFSQKVINASMGSFVRVRVITTSLAEALGGTDTPVLGCDLEGEPYMSIAPPAAAIVVIGSEGRGLSPAVASRVTQWLTIPKLGQAESLNAAVAAGIICAHLRGSAG